METRDKPKGALDARVSHTGRTGSTRISQASPVFGYIKNELDIALIDIRNAALRNDPQAISEITRLKFTPCLRMLEDFLGHVELAHSYNLAQSAFYISSLDNNGERAPKITQGEAYMVELGIKFL